MNSGRFAFSGWVVAAALAGVMVGSGFQTPSIKLGVVDIAGVISKSDTGKKMQTNLDAMKSVRQAILEFLDQYRVATIEQANRYRELMLKADRTKPEDAELDRLKADIIASSKKSQELATKTSLTPEDRTMVEEYSRRSQLILDLSVRWYREFNSDVETWYNDRKNELYLKARGAANEVGSKEGYTMVLEGSVAIYGANDISDATLTAMNAKP